MSGRGPIQNKIPGLRQRQLANGTWRVWWEPNKSARDLGFGPLDLDGTRPTWSEREAKKRNDDVDAARSGTPVRKPIAGGRTIDALIDDYQRSIAFTSLAAKTRTSYKINTGVISRKWGSKNVLEFTKPIVATWYETLFTTTGAYNAAAVIGMMSILMNHAELRGWRPEGTNPRAGIKFRGMSGRDRAGSWAEYDALITAGDRLGWYAATTGIALATLQAQRQTDVYLAKLQEFQRVRIEADADPILVWGLVRSKRGTYGAMPLHEEVAPRIERILQDAHGDNQRTALLIDEATGRPYSGDLFRKRWSAIRSEAAKTCPSVKSLQFRDLRRTFGVWAREGDASKSDVGDVLGNAAGTNPQLSGIYMPPSFHTARRAINAIQRPGKKGVS